MRMTARFGRIRLAIGLAILLCHQLGLAEGLRLEQEAVEWSRKLLHSEATTVQPYDTYWNPDGTPHAELFFCESPGADREVLTLGLNPNPASRQVLFYYFAEPFDRQFRPADSVAADSRVIVSPSGLLLQTGKATRQIPFPMGFGADLVSAAPGDFQRPLRPTSPPGTGPTEVRPCSGDDEMVIPGVPNYLWYLNCALTSESMVLAYWNDRACPGLVPGNSSTQGWYYAITEELMWLRDDRIKRYGAATELGYSWQFTQTALPNKEWPTYVSAIQTAAGPLSVSWSGAPYGAHSTVGVGYKEANSNRFLILHDTWVSTPAYVNYDVYSNSIVTISTTALASGTNAAPCTNPVPTLAYGTLLSPTNLVFSPALSFTAYSYHCFEAGDFNRDGLVDLIVGSFRNNVSSSARLSLYTNDNARFTRDASFAPTLDWYECVHVARACDFDRDGDLDVAVSGYWMPARVYVNTGKTLTNQSIVLGNEYSTFGYSDLAWGDLDADGDDDLVTCIANPYQLEGRLKLYRWHNGAFELMGSLGFGSDWYSAIKLCDLNHDQLPEIVCANRRGSVLAFLNVNGQFTNAPYFQPAQGHGALTLDAADVDADGYVEIVTVDDGRIVIFEHDAAGLCAEPRHLATELQTFAKDLKLADLNRDGFPELLVANFNTPSAIFLNRRGTFETRPIWLSARAEPGVRVQVFESEDPNQTIIGFARARGATAEFFRVTNLPVFTDIRSIAGIPALGVENLLPGKRYAIQRTDRLAPGAWSEVLEFQSAGSATNWSDLHIPTNSQSYYRVRCLD